MDSIKQYLQLFPLHFFGTIKNKKFTGFSLETVTIPKIPHISETNGNGRQLIAALKKWLVRNLIEFGLFCTQM